MGNKVVIFGATEMALLSHYYLTHDSPYEVIGIHGDIVTSSKSGDCAVFLLLLLRILNPSTLLASIKCL